MTRVIAGSARGRRLRTPAGDATRPTSDRVREALFSSIESELGTVAGARFLDLYAGSGAVGLEAWSRGAGEVTLVEQHPAAVAVIRANVAALSATATVRQERVERFAAAPAPEPYDVVFADPPYPVTTGELHEVLGSLASSGLVAADSVVVVERPRRSDWSWPAGYEGVRERKYGETMLWYGRVAPTADQED